ncbi:T9SS-dependent choice-of-anchor J family protein [Psychroserpens jangbogonensis]|uniref:T9SS-dependent choice-of-anchor J family protein n=1 Tax=Psychroserpens jangbogonensis TaxID=1484460 RepID=UPI00053E5FD0|nr:T9SS type A sorting domain-containing protein [Psychroserpens jangbogonensis]
MKKITFLMTLLLMWSINSNAQYVNEDFESGTFPPAGWIDEAGTTDSGAPDFFTENGDVWGENITRSNSPSTSAFFDDFGGDQYHDRWLISPAFDLSTAVGPELIYFDNVNFATFAATQEVLWSEDYTGSGDPALATWNLLNGATGAEDTWVENGPYPIPSTGTAVYVAFSYQGEFAAEWYVDDVLVRDALTCTPAVGSVTLVEDCPSLEYSIDVTVTDLGDSTTVTVTNDGGEPDVDVTSVPTTVTLGPYASGTTVNVSLLHESDPACDVNLGATVDACPLPPPANDDLANAQPIDCTTTALTGSTANATLDEDDAPDGFTADMDAPNVWFSYDSATEGAADVTVSLCGSTYDTSFLVYTGTSGALTIVAGNDDNAAACGVGSVQSEGTFTANGTDTYLIAVEGWDPGSTGDFTMTISCVASCSPVQMNQDCASATALAVDGIPTTQDNTCATVNAATTSCELFSTIADVWFTFVAPASGEVNIVTALGTATAAHAAVYEGTCGALTEIACSTAVTGGGSLTALTPGNTYYIQLWNNGSEEGTMDITLSDASLSLSTFENENAFTYFPNPVKNELSLRAQSNIQNVSVFNMLGQEVLRAAPNTLESNLDMNGLSQGAYFVQVTINNVTETVRILKQ